jgi:hypothetical protein
MKLLYCFCVSLCVFTLLNDFRDRWHESYIGVRNWKKLLIFNHTVCNKITAEEEHAVKIMPLVRGLIAKWIIVARCMQYSVPHPSFKGRTEKRLIKTFRLSFYLPQFHASSIQFCNCLLVILVRWTPTALSPHSRYLLHARSYYVCVRHNSSSSEFVYLLVRLYLF